MSARRQSAPVMCEVPGCPNRGPVMMSDRNGSVDVCYGHSDNTITAIREAIAAGPTAAAS